MKPLVIVSLIIVLLSACSQSPSVLGTPFEEASQGDLSDDRNEPTRLSLSVGENLISGTTQAGDLDYFSFTLAQGQELTKLELRSYVSVDPRAFIGVQRGTVFSEPNEGTNEAELLGWLLFDSGAVGTDILPAMGEQEGARLQLLGSANRFNNRL